MTGNLLNYLLSFLRVAAYAYIIFVGYDSFRENNKDRNMAAVMVGNILMASGLLVSLIFKVFTSSGLANATVSEVVSVSLTPLAVFWAMTHFYIYFRSHKKDGDRKA